MKSTVPLLRLSDDNVSVGYCLIDGRVLFVMEQFAATLQASIGHNLHSTIPHLASQQLHALNHSSETRYEELPQMTLEWKDMFLIAEVTPVPLTCRLQRCIDSFIGIGPHITNTSSHVLPHDASLHEWDNGRSSEMKSDKKLMMEYPQLVSSSKRKCSQRPPSIEPGSLAEYVFMPDWAV